MEGKIIPVVLERFVYFAQFLDVAWKLHTDESQWDTFQLIDDYCVEIDEAAYQELRQSIVEGTIAEKYHDFYVNMVISSNTLLDYENDHKYIERQWCLFFGVDEGILTLEFEVETRDEDWVLINEEPYDEWSSYDSTKEWQELEPDFFKNVKKWLEDVQNYKQYSDMLGSLDLIIYVNKKG